MEEAGRLWIEFMNGILFVIVIIMVERLDSLLVFRYFFFQAEDGIRDLIVTGVQTCALPISAEGRYRLTRGCIEAFTEAANPFSLITRGPLIVRDLDVLQEASRRAEVGVTFSIPTVDPEVWRKTEPGTAPPRQRLRALKTLVEGGIKANVGMAPILPGLSDRPEQLAEVVRAAREAGAVSVWANLLYLKPGTREHFLECLAHDWPELLPEYERLYAGRAYIPASEQEPVRTELARLRRELGIADRRRARLAPEPHSEQLRLAV